MCDAVDNDRTSDPAVRRALAIVLMREVLPLLDDLREDIAANHLQMAIDTVLRGCSPQAAGSC
ncbi:MAG: hypothetical protein QHC67_15335 [Sphingobium sp.]|uniref:hypothetical protein n=1 Tax=Sphingobium sp. TaxID=1912891 RepID=UPI0029B13D7D|nr:hypothetical protein [Sphingobium sp.]MDX3911172.1 hypothetical protein [Sphingobium sp.]